MDVRTIGLIPNGTTQGLTVYNSVGSGGGFSNDTNDYPNYNSIFQNTVPFITGTTNILNIQNKRGYFTKCLFNSVSTTHGLTITVDDVILFNSGGNVANTVTGIAYFLDQFFLNSASPIFRRPGDQLLNNTQMPSANLSPIPFTAGTAGISTTGAPIFFSRNLKIDFTIPSNGNVYYEYQYATN